MKQRRRLLLVVAAFIGTPAAAQLTAVPHSGERSIIVTGERPKGQPAPEIEMSKWKVAETDHLFVFSKGDAKELARIAQHLEKLHFLLSVLLNRVDDPDETLKLSVTMIGDPADFDHLGLRNIRWQQGPYPREFPTQIYYDPREDGAVAATTHADQCFKLVRDAQILTSEDMLGANVTPDPVQEQLGTVPTIPRNMPTATGASGTACNGNPNKVSVTAESRLYSTFAQHYLLTYFPAAYPRWYLEGFGEIFSNMEADKDGVIEYGRWPDKYRDVIDKFGHYPVQKVLDGTYLHDKHWFPAFSPYRAWGLAHLLFFSNEWKAPLHNYLAAVARGEPPERAAAALGNVNKLAKELALYHGKKVPFERLTYPPGRFLPPIVRQLRESEAAYVRGRLELGARVTIPDGAISDADVARARQKALEARDKWLGRLRKNSADNPRELADQQLLAEGECRSGNAAYCLAAADRALAIAPNNPVALSWKGSALAMQAQNAPSVERGAQLDRARSFIIQANHADTESVVPLLAYYRSYEDSGQAVPEAAIDGVAKSLDAVPSAPTTRLMFGTALINQRDLRDARRILLPLTDGAFDPPEKPKAQQLLQSLATKAAPGVSAH